MRCYEAYCYFKNKLDEECKSERTMQRVKQYVEFMESKSVKFDRSVGDKALFVRLQKQLGTEKAVTQPSLVTLLVECAECGMGTRDPTEIKGENYCPNCAKDARSKASSQPQRTEQKLYKETADFRIAQRRPHDSRLQLEAIQELQLEGWPIETNQKISLSEHEPDGLLRNVRMILNVDGVVHEGKEDRDERIDKRLRMRGWNPVRSRNKSYSQKEKERVKSEFREEMVRAYVEKGLDLPSECVSGGKKP